MLGLRATPADASSISPASSVYGAELTLPGEFLGAPDPPSSVFLEDFRRRMDLSMPTPVRHNSATQSPPDPDTYKKLMEAKFVFVRRDGHVPSLTPLYEGPYEVVYKGT